MSFVDLAFLTRVIRRHENWENLINASVLGVTGMTCTRRLPLERVSLYNQFFTALQLCPPLCLPVRK
jgi:hypothetical protein